MVQPPILCVDDEASNLALIRQILRKDYALTFAKNGAEALRAVVKHRPALILLDVDLPDLDGYTIARTLKQDPRTAAIPIIFVTGKDKDADESIGFEAGGVDYITKPYSPSILRARVRTHLSLVSAASLASSHRDAIQMLGMAGHYSDSDTGTHIWRMAAYARALAVAAGWSGEDAKLLEQAAPMHDTGKIGIPDAILKKPGPLDVDEWQVMQRHPQIGYDILSRSSAPLFRLAAEIALYHHEHWDGNGYPAGLAGERIPESARIVALADVFDALTTQRPYKEPWPLAQVMELFQQQAGAQFEPRLATLFAAILPQILQIQDYWSEREPGEDLPYRAGTHVPARHRDG
ncbi:response regulator [Xanthomonas hyacinthi]|uniref:Two-component system response regulator n=1 Tax=Xanthomonas hyacinthi TaxID=56455 RepID=A0A2S7ERR9_9XANT|nr:HD domain-containing phosphohydrolase [Xanthomonas hyacinthi]PPU95820.1 two-component system response regulator [Xanthomonas hyacinthi]QGY75328.1 response regulator [Xanthomonas hyacinthi]